jgi:hypothetical protein
MKVYLDDERPCPDGWILCRWPHEVIELLKTGQVEALSLDHDLGPSDATGYDVLVWLEEAVHNGFVPPRYCYIHTANPAARDRMMAARFAIYKSR